MPQFATRFPTMAIPLRILPSALFAACIAAYAAPSGRLIFPGASDDVKIIEQQAREAEHSTSHTPGIQSTLRTSATETKSKVRRSKVINKNSGKAPIRKAAPAAPVQTAKPRPSRSQILQNELQSERAALARAQAQLAHAQKNGGNTARLQQAIRDRQANIRALQSEIR